MNLLAPNNLKIRSKRPDGFSLIEVVLAIGIFLVTVMALVGLLGPTLQSVDDVEATDEVIAVVETVNAFLQNSPDIAPAGSEFDAIYNAVYYGGEATIFVYRYYSDTLDGQGNPVVRIEVGFRDEENSYVGSDSIVNSAEAEFEDAAGPIYKVVLTPSSVIPSAYTSFNAASQTYTLNGALDSYLEGSFAMEVRIFVEDPPAPGVTFDDSVDLAALAQEEPIFYYNTAVVR